LWLSHNAIGDAGMDLLASMVRERVGVDGVESQLMTLDVRSNKLGPRSAHSLTDMILDLSMLTHLDARGNGLVTGVSGEGVRHLANAVLGSSSMQWFGMIPIEQIRNNAVKRLVLDKQGLGPVEGLVLSALVGSASSITHLSVAENELGNGGVGILAEAALANSAGLKLQGLNVADNGVGQWGAQRLTDLVGKMRSIVELNVGGNFFDSDAKMALVIAPHNPSLKVMY
jgi:Ran GTPase-activating protein (RanGAP) involved in mRNA processing and transport